MLTPVDQNTGNNGQQETANPILAHPGLRALLQQQIALRDGTPPAGTPAPTIMPAGGASVSGPTAPPIQLPQQSLSEAAHLPTQQPNVVGPSKNEATLYNLQNSKPGLENVYHSVTNSDFGQAHPMLGKLTGIAGQIPATAADLAMSLKGLPVLGNSLSSIGQVMPGTTEQHNAKLGEAQGAVNADEINAEKGAQTEGLQANIPMRQAQTEHFNAETAAGTPVPPSPALLKDHPEIEGMKLPAAGWSQLEKAFTGATSHEKIAGMNNDSRETIAGDKNSVLLDIAGMHVKTSKDIADAHNKTLMLIRQMQDATSEHNADAKGTGAGGANKVPMVITNRASLANNVVENANEIEKIIDANPDLVGAVRGRISNVDQLMGSDDPNLQALGVHIHNVALASNGAHGLRSDRAIKGTEDAIFSHFHAGPNALRGALEAQKDSVGTFLQDEQNFSHTGNRVGTPPAAQGGGPKKGDTKNGFTFDGTGWTK
jgi:hypothetical protein